MILEELSFIMKQETSIAEEPISMKKKDIGKNIEYTNIKL